ncbi:hypothetical protein [Sphingobium sp. B2]|uniref:hypothetical protein n=1 Tax=Sphingobium sp. B2 TaxID=2583228 RepID=UPI0011AB0EAF|nr:hypothetical protein [Sphingobium sp. B2]
MTTRRTAALERIAKPLVIVNAYVLNEKALVEKDVCASCDGCSECLLGRMQCRAIVAWIEPHFEYAKYPVDRIVTQFARGPITQRFWAKSWRRAGAVQFSCLIAEALCDIDRALKCFDLAEFVSVRARGVISGVD